MSITETKTANINTSVWNLIQRDWNHNDSQRPVFVVLRIGHWCVERKTPVLSRVFKMIKYGYLHWLHLSFIRYLAQCFIRRCRLPHINGIVISPTCIGENCTIFHQVTIGEIERDDGSRGAVYIGCGAKILGKTSIGSNVMIAAGAIVIMNVPVGSTVIGVNQIL